MLSGVRAQTSCSEAIAQASWITHEPELSRALDILADAGLIFRRGSPPYASYLFKHALVNDAAHGSLLRRRREAGGRALGNRSHRALPIRDLDLGAGGLQNQSGGKRIVRGLRRHARPFSRGSRSIIRAAGLKGPRRSWL